MSGGIGSGPTIIPGQTIIAQPANRQTQPYADRPFVEVRSGRGFLTPDAYQYLTRLGQGLIASIENVGSIIEVSNTVIADLSTVEAEIAVLQTEVAEIEQELTAGLGNIPPLPPTIVNPGAVEASVPLWPSFNFEPADIALVEADARAVAYWGL